MILYTSILIDRDFTGVHRFYSRAFLPGLYEVSPSGQKRVRSGLFPLYIHGR